MHRARRRSALHTLETDPSLAFAFRTPPDPFTHSLSHRFWKGDLSADELLQAGKSIRAAHWQLQRQAGVDLVAANDFSYYDHVLDASAMLGVVPKRFGAELRDGRSVTLDDYFRMARGRSQAKSGSAAAADVQPCEMTKWFDTNYHYIVPELEESQKFRLASTKVLDETAEALQLGYQVKPVLLGPLTYLWLSKPCGAAQVGCARRVGAVGRADSGAGSAASLAGGVQRCVSASGVGQARSQDPAGHLFRGHRSEPGHGGRHAGGRAARGCGARAAAAAGGGCGVAGAPSAVAGGGGRAQCVAHRFAGGADGHRAGAGAPWRTPVAGAELLAAACATGGSCGVEPGADSRPGGGGGAAGGECAGGRLALQVAAYLQPAGARPPGRRH
eukprot:ctg_393.g198